MSTHPRSLVLLILLGIPLLLATACGTPDPSLTTNAQGAGPGGEILYVAGGNVYLWSDGDTQQITHDIQAASPRWSPAGERFAYVEMHADLGYSDLIIANRDDELMKQVTNNRPDAEPYSADFVCDANWAIDPAWSPVGEQLAWVSDLGGWEAPKCIYRLSDPLYLWFSETWDAPPYLLPASAEIPVTTFDGIAVTQESPTFSPDGQRLALVVKAEPAEIWTIDLNSGELLTLVAGSDAAYDPAWSPDGANLAFIQRQDAANNVWIAPLDGSDPYQLTTTGSAVSPVWSPDGRFLAFFSLVDDRFEAQYVELTANSDGRLTASEPQKLFDADNIDTSSGMSWFNR